MPANRPPDGVVMQPSEGWVPWGALEGREHPTD
jgi:hypothetical protein